MSKGSNSIDGNYLLQKTYLYSVNRELAEIRIEIDASKLGATISAEHINKNIHEEDDQFPIYIDESLRKGPCYPQDIQFNRIGLETIDLWKSLGIPPAVILRRLEEKEIIGLSHHQRKEVMDALLESSGYNELSNASSLPISSIVSVNLNEASLSSECVANVIPSLDTTSTAASSSSLSSTISSMYSQMFPPITIGLSTVAITQGVPNKKSAQNIRISPTTKCPSDLSDNRLYKQSSLQRPIFVPDVPMTATNKQSLHLCQKNYDKNHSSICSSSSNRSSQSFVENLDKVRTVQLLTKDSSRIARKRLSNECYKDLDDAMHLSSRNQMKQTDINTDMVQCIEILVQEVSDNSDKEPASPVSPTYSTIAAMEEESLSSEHWDLDDLLVSAQNVDFAIQVRQCD